MRTELLEKIKKDNRAYDMLEKNGCNPIGVYGKYVIASDKPYPSFTVAADTLFPGWDSNSLN